MKLSTGLSFLLTLALVSAAPYHSELEHLEKRATSWPSAKKTISNKSPIVVKAGQTFDGLKKNNNQWVRYDRGRKGLGDCTKIEGGKNDAVFILEKGATLKNVILGANSIEHVHCIGDGCTVENVWWEDVCEDALTLRDSKNGNAKFYVKGGGAKNGSDKIIQHNSAGTVYISNFIVQNSGKLYRACGNCKSGYQNKRKVVMTNVTATNVKVIAGINKNYGDQAVLKNVKVNNGHVCQTFKGNNNGKEPSSTGYQCESKNINNCTCK
ncbi:polysaccharide lyase family 3 protein [Piromyces sp. E2]|nr:polysaccharide lyase family 3 protein [Piromyces sp. E2]|eukprot:OUM64475.1 polysaccharide lyase family 3 protein [Piromyces sp. E2]